MLATAGGVAFFGLVAVFPGLAAVVSIYGLFSDPSAIGQHLSLLSGTPPAGVLELLFDQLTAVIHKSAGVLSTASLLSLLIALWSANSGVSALFDALNVIYKENEKRSLLRFYATTQFFTLSAVIFILAAITLVVVLPIALNHIGLGSSTELLCALRAGQHCSSSLVWASRWCTATVQVDVRRSGAG